MIRSITYFVITTLLPSATLVAKESPSWALEQLIEGNDRFVKSMLLHPNRGEEERTSTVAGQTPFAVILGCSDSRVSPEIIFDQGIGDLFIVRVAGNVLGNIELESLEYAVFYLGATLIIVLGHENCGAVQAVLDGHTKDIENIAMLMQKALSSIKSTRPSLETAVKTNAAYVADQLRQNKAIAKLITQGQVLVVDGYYELGSGRVSFSKASAPVPRPFFYKNAQ